MIAEERREGRVQLKSFLTGVSLAWALVLAFLVGLQLAGAFIGPALPPYSENGAIGIDASKNLSVGTSAPSSSAKFFIIPSGGNAYGLEVMQSGGANPALVVAQDGKVGVATSAASLPGTLSVQGSVWANTLVAGLSAGIGASPISSAPLTVNKSGSQSFNLYLTESASGDEIQVVFDKSGNGNVSLVAESTDGNKDDGFIIKADSSELESIFLSTDNSPTNYVGNVGIGTARPHARLHVGIGDIYVSTQGNGIILRDTVDGTCYRVVITSGVLTPNSVTCP